MKYDQERYLKIEELVKDYQEGDMESGYELIEYFELYINKYYKILKKGLINLNDKESRSFITMFIDDLKARRALARSYQPTEARREAYKAASMLASMCKNIPDEDILQELRYNMLLMAKRYKNKGKSFTAYVSSSFKFYVQNTISEMTLDPIVHACELNLRFDEELCLEKAEDIEKEISDMYMEKAKNLKMVEEDELGPRWESGLTCGEEFEDLTPNQRMIIKMKYDEGKSDLDIAEKIGLHRNTIRRQREEGIKNIKYEG
jgi:RNA polymerase sigma factor (sigma-70 family)